MDMAHGSPPNCFPLFSFALLLGSRFAGGWEVRSVRYMSRCLDM